MKIIRIDGEKQLDKKVRILDIQLETGQVFRFREDHTGLLIHEVEGNSIVVYPRCANEISVSSTGDWMGEKS